MNNEQLRHKYSVTIAYLFMNKLGYIKRYFLEVMY
jgi:hypothetical protein